MLVTGTKQNKKRKQRFNKIRILVRKEAEAICHSKTVKYPFFVLLRITLHEETKNRLYDPQRGNTAFIPKIWPRKISQSMALRGSFSHWISHRTMGDKKPGIQRCQSARDMLVGSDRNGMRWHVTCQTSSSLCFQAKWALAVQGCPPTKRCKYQLLGDECTWGRFAWKWQGLVGDLGRALIAAATPTYSHSVFKILKSMISDAVPIWWRTSFDRLFGIVSKN